MSTVLGLSFGKHPVKLDVVAHSDLVISGLPHAEGVLMTLGVFSCKVRHRADDVRL